MCGSCPILSKPTEHGLVLRHALATLLVEVHIVSTCHRNNVMLPIAHETSSIYCQPDALARGKGKERQAASD